MGNPDAAKPSDTWSGWSSAFAWRERVAAYDDHLASVRREVYERVIKEEAARQAREIEKTRYRYNELMTLGYVQAAEWLENAQPSDLRGQDVLKIIGLHMDAVKAFGVEEPRVEDDWTEEDDADFAEIIREIDAEQAEEGSDEGSEEGEDDSDQSEDGKA